MNNDRDIAAVRGAAGARRRADTGDPIAESRSANPYC